MKKELFITIVFIMIFQFINAQSWMRNLNLPNKKDISFYDIQKAFYQYAKGKDTKDIKGYKQFKRWEWFYSTHVDENGYVPSSETLWKNYRRSAMTAKQVRSNPSNWTALFPDSIPHSPDSTSIPGIGRINAITFHPLDSNTLWICSSQGGLWKTTDNGQTWICLTDDLPLLRTSDLAVDPNNTDVLYLATGDINYVLFNTIASGRYYQFGMGILKSVDGGQTWTTTGLSFNLTDGESSLIRKIVVNPANSNEILAAGVDGIYKSQDAGDTWIQILTDAIIDLDVNPMDSNTMYASGIYKSGNIAIMKTTDFGDSWSVLNTAIPEDGNVLRIETAIAPSDTNYIYAITCGSDEGLYAIYKSIDAGNSWEAIAAHDTTKVANCHNLIPNLLGWGDGGLSGFMPDEGGQGTYDLTLVVDPTDKDKIYSGGINMWGSADGGITWDIVSMWLKLFGHSLHADQHFSVYHPITKKLYQANDGGIEIADSVQIGSYSYIYNNCIDWSAAFAGDYDHAIIQGCYTLPTNWKNITHGLNITEFYRLGGCKSNAQIIVAGSQDNGTFMYNDGAWMNTWGGDGMEAMIDHYNDSIIFATNYMGTLNKSTDGGYSYTSNITSYITDTVGETGDWVTPFVMHPINSNIIYAAYQNVWKSVDGGLTWTKISSFGSSSLKTLAVSASKPDSVIYCSRSNIIYKTTDGGNSWQTIVEPDFPAYIITGIAIDGSDENNIWVTFSGYDAAKKVFHSTDGGNSWTNISEGLPNVAMNCIVHQDSTLYGVQNAVYVGTDIGVYYTNDSILSSLDKWVLYSNGLPNVVVAELEIHYSEQKIRAATYGRGLWESDLFSPSEPPFGIQLSDMNNFDFKIFPNPASSELTIEVTAGDKINHIKVNIFNMKGEKIKSYTNIFRKNYKKEIDIQYFSSGIYIIQLDINGIAYRKKFIKE